MIAVIPVAGSGTRLRPLTHSKPKALLHVGSKSILSHIIDTLVPLGCTRIVLIISHEGANIPAFVRTRYPEIDVQSVVQEQQLGLGHAVSLARPLVGNEELVIMYGDTIIDGDFSDVLSTERDGLIAVKEVDDPRRFGVVVTEGGIITNFVEKPSEPQSNLAIVGFNYIRNSRELFVCLEKIMEEGVKTKGEYQITDAFQRMVERGAKLAPLTIDGWFDCGTPQSLLDTNRYMLAKEGNNPALPDSIIVPPVYVPESAVIRSSIIGPNVSVGEGAVIEKSIVADSIIGGGAKVLHSSLSGSLIGDNAQVTERPRVLTIGDNSSLDFEVG